MIVNAMKYAEFLAAKSPDEKMKVGCAIFDAHLAEVIGEGFNGNPEPLPQVRDSMEPGKGGFLHAEMRAAIACNAPRHWKKEVYVTLPPCTQCSKVLLELGNVTKVVYKPHPQYSLEGLILLKNCGIEIVEWKE